MSLDVLETDAHGHVVVKPVVEWMVTTDQGITVVAGFEYKNSTSDPKKECGKIQFGLTAQQALSLRRLLVKSRTAFFKRLQKSRQLQKAVDKSYYSHRPWVG